MSSVICPLIDDVQTTPLPGLFGLPVLFLDTATPSLVAAVSSFERNLRQLGQFIRQPAVLRYDDLDQLRRRASNPEVSTNWRSQIRLAVELVRLGRRREALHLLAVIDRRLPLETEETLVYRLWLLQVQTVTGGLDCAAPNIEKLARFLDAPLYQRIAKGFAALTPSDLTRSAA